MASLGNTFLKTHSILLPNLQSQYFSGHSLLQMEESCCHKIEILNALEEGVKDVFWQVNSSIFQNEMIVVKKMTLIKNVYTRTLTKKYDYFYL